ncbi:MAG: hypothetical protein IT359_05145 [Gemmatimonadaceae bacterium]|nr:hypothetical protein [Gemmatimonadaceae bacterium]
MSFRTFAPSLAIVLAASGAVVHPASIAGQQPAPRTAPQPYVVGNPLGVTRPAPNDSSGTFAPMSANVTVFGAIHNAESCSYDAARGLIVVPNRGVAQRVQANDAFVSLIRHDGSVHTPRWIGVQPPATRASVAPALTLNEPFGSDIVGGVLYLADSDGNASTSDPRVAVIRRFDMKTGVPRGEIRVDRSPWLNDLAVTADGTIYATQTGGLGPDADPATWQVLKITRDGAIRTFVQGTPLRMPNGIAIDPRGNIVVVNSGDSAVLTFAPSGTLLVTEHAAQAGSDGVVIMPDGTKYVSSVFQGGVSRITPGRPAELIARNIPSAASMCYDAAGNQLVIPMNDQNGLAFIRLGERPRGRPLRP